MQMQSTTRNEMAGRYVNTPRYGNTDSCLHALAPTVDTPDPTTPMVDRWPARVGWHNRLRHTRTEPLFRDPFHANCDELTRRARAGARALVPAPAVRGTHADTATCHGMVVH